MSVFGKIGKVLKKAAPIVATVASFIPATAPFAVAAKGALAASKIGRGVLAVAKVAKTARTIGMAVSAARPTAKIAQSQGLPPMRTAKMSALPSVRRQIQIPPIGQPSGVMNMSILGGLGSIAGRVAGRSLPGIGATAVSAGRGVISAGRGLIQRYPRSARVLRDLGLFAVGGLVYDAAGNLMGQRAPARRINPMNVKAMRRSIRRVKAGRKICAEIDRMLPKRRAAAACAPAFTRRKRKC